MEDKVKIYCVFCDTMPLTDDIIRIAKKNNMFILLQVGGCFTMTSILEMFTGKMPSDVLKNGMGHRCLDKYRNKKTKKIYTPWNSDNINFKLSKLGWDVHLHGFPPNSYIHGNIYTDSYNGGYINRYEKIRKNKKPSYSGKMMDDILIGNSNKSIEWQEKEVKFIKNLPSDKIFSNTFYLIEYEHFHSFLPYVKKIKGENNKDKVRKKVNKKIIELMNSWDFDESNSIFWFFSDHGFPEKIGKIPKANGYLSWVLFKDNIEENKIKPKSKIISIRDFVPTIMNKFNYSYKRIKENCDINKKNDRNRIYFVEDGRGKINRNQSTSAIACKVVKWKEDSPMNILQVSYFKNNKKFYCHLNFLNRDGFFKKCIRIKKNNKQYLNDIFYLRKKLIKRFKWIR